MSRSTSHIYEPATSEGIGRIEQVQPPLVFDREGIRAVDGAAVEEYGIPSAILMENAARGVADHAIAMLHDLGETSPYVVIVCGSGNNGGDGYALARHLHNRGIELVIARIGEPSPTSDAGMNREVCRNMALTEIDAAELDDLLNKTHVSLIVDAIFGTGLDRPVSGRAAQIIQTINNCNRAVLAVDVPSGMDCNTGEALGVAVKANRTVTFVGLKIGFIGLDAQKLLGEVVIADIGVPSELAQRFGKRIETPHPDMPEHESDRHLRARRPGQ